MSDNLKKGGFGEQLAQKHLIDQGYYICERNFRCTSGEIDIIAYKNKTYVFVEVKYRRDLSKGYPAESVTKLKQRKIRRTAEYYIYKNNLRKVDFRIDVIQIVDDGASPFIEQIENAF